MESSQQSKFISIKFKIIILVLTGLVVLQGCNQVQNQTKLIETIDYSQVNSDFDGTHDQIAGLTFNVFSQKKHFDFNSDNQLLLKINFSKMRIDQSSSDLKLIIGPKSLNQVQHFTFNDDSKLDYLYFQTKNKSNTTDLNSKQGYSFNVNKNEINKTHYLWIQANYSGSINLELFDTQSLFLSEFNLNQFLSSVYSIILFLVICSAILFGYTQTKLFLYFAVYLLISLYSMIWQSGTISALPLLSWPIWGEHSHYFYKGLAHIAAIIFLLELLNIKLNKTLVTKFLSLMVFFLIASMLLLTVQYYFIDGLAFNTTQILMKPILVTSGFIIFGVLFNKVKKHRKPDLVLLFLAWTLIMISMMMGSFFSSPPISKMSWMFQSHELFFLLHGLMVVFAVGIHTMKFKPLKKPLKKVTSVKTNEGHHQWLLNNFNSEIKKLVKDTTLNADEIIEKTHIKFHLMLNRAFPVKNSMVLEKEKLTGICTTGFGSADLELLKMKAQSLNQQANNDNIEQKHVNTSGDKYSLILFVPLLDPNYNGVIFILSLKNNEPLHDKSLLELQKFCGLAYIELLKARSIYLSALDANLDPLTLCHNKLSIESIIKQSLKQRKLTTLAVIKISNMNHILTLNGESNFDQCVIEMINSLRDALSNFAKIGRKEFDEFLVVFSGKDLNDAISRINNWFSNLENHYFTEQKIKLTCSIGMAESRMRETYQSLYIKANKALYHSKSQGNNQLSIYETSMANASSQ